MKPLRAPFLVTVSLVAAAAAILTLGCDGKAHGSDLYGASSSSSGGSSGTSGGSSGIVPAGTCSSTTQYGDPCNPGETTCTTQYYEVLECSNGYWQPGVVISRPPPPSACPLAEPFEGTFCEAPGSDCSYPDLCPDRPRGAASNHRWQCLSGGTWQRQDVYIASCPVTRPQGGESCAACAGSYPAQCTYFDGSGCAPAVASCEPKTQTWMVAVSTCHPPAADAGAPDPGP